MATLMRQLHAQPDSIQNPFSSRALVEHCRRMLERNLGLHDRATVLNQLARHSLNSGDTPAAIRALDEFEKTVKDAGFQLQPQDQLRLSFQRGLCYLRLGEQDNCVINHTSESCLLPIRPAGYHRRPEGSREAIRYFTEVLQKNPDERATRWLLNIAYMTLGEWPDKVPSAWVIPPSAFAAEYEIGRFPDVAGSLGLDTDDLAGGSILEDFDNDGDLDLMTSAWQGDGRFRYFRNDGKGRFEERTTNAALAEVFGGLNIQQTDYNNDGHMDVFLLRGAWLGKAGRHPNSLLRNNGDGTFEDVTEAARLLSFHPTQAATWFDYNNDGWLDVFIANESVGADHNPCELYRNNRDGTFTECSGEAGVSLIGFYKGVTSGDYDGDGRMDLFLSSREGKNRLLHNEGAGTNGHWRFRDVTTEASIRPTTGSFPCWFFDYNNDGRLDILVSGYAIGSVADIAADYLGQKHDGERPRLYRNNGDGTFADVTRGAKLARIVHGMGSNFGDLDNDGWLDFYMATGDPDLGTLIPNRMFRNAEGRFFQDVTASAGTGHLQKGHGVSFGDIDQDGDQDVHVVMGGAYPGDNYRNSLFLNPGHSNNWIGLKLVGKTSNRPGIGARIKVVVKTDEGSRDIYKTVNSGGSFGSSPLRQQIGIGKAKAVERVEVLWPATGRTDTLLNLQKNHFYVVYEGQTNAVAMDYRPIKLDLRPQLETWCGPTNIVSMR